MNHQPFRDWILSDEKLSADQTQRLKEHLDSCASCKQVENAWTEVETTFRRLPQIAPAPGFINRWQANLAAYYAHKAQQKGWIIIGITVFVVVALLGLLVVQLWDLLQAPGPYLVAWFSRVVNLVAIVSTIQNIVNPFSWDIPIYTFLGMFFLAGMISFMSVLWLATYRRFSMARRVG